MSENHQSNGDYDSLNRKGEKKNVQINDDLPSLRKNKKSKTNSDGDTGLAGSKNKAKVSSREKRDDEKLPSQEAFGLLPKNKSEEYEPAGSGEAFDHPASEESLGDQLTDHLAARKEKKRLERAEKDFQILNRDSWVKRNGHHLTYIGLYVFSILVLYRPYELVPGLGFLSATAFYVAAATLAVFIPTQLSTEGSLTYLSLEVKFVILLTVIALVSIPIAKSQTVAWMEFNDVFLKAVLMFVVMVNVLRTRRRLMGMIWLSLGIAVVLSYIGIGLYWRGELDFEGYRVGVDIGGMFGNPNDLALHLVMMTPLAIVLGAASKNLIKKLSLFCMAGLFVAATMVTYSRGGFLGLVCVSVFLIWKLSRQNRIQVLAVAAVAGFLIILFAPGNYGVRLLSIFVPGLDSVGSRGQRTELLLRSIYVSIRNPWGIGIGNFPIVGIRNLVSHNSYTQVSSELGVLGFLAYMGFLLSPFRRLAAIERRLFEDERYNWFFYLAVGLQASLIGYMVSSFFVSVAYNWFIYYMVAYAVAFRRIYSIEFNVEEKASRFSLKNYIAAWQN